MKKSGLLTAAKQLLQTPEQSVSGCNVHNVYVCVVINNVSLEAGLSAYTAGRELKQFIREHIHKQTPTWDVVTTWLKYNPAVGRFPTAEEAQEYRHLWLDDMIAYWQSKGE